MRLPASAWGSPPSGTGLGRARPSFSRRGAVFNVQRVSGSVPGACGKPPGSPAKHGQGSPHAEASRGFGVLLHSNQVIHTT